MTGETLAARLAQLSPEARAELNRRLAGRRAGATIPRREPGTAVPMSFAQWRLWFLEQLRPGTNAWNTPVAARLRGELDLERLASALSLLVARHATLRTVFSAPGGKPVPVLRPPAEVQVPVTEAPPGDPEAAIRSFVDREVARPFDLEADLMLRASVLRLGPEDHVLVIIAHHIACDGWSKGLLLEELGIAYDALIRGAQPELPELAIEYADYALWQRELLSGENLSRLSDYWVARLQGAPPALELPTDRPRPRVQAFKGAVQWLEVSPELTSAAVTLGRAERATPFMTLLAAFKVLLAAHSGREDILVGSPSAMRTHPELERIVGLFANTLVYRTSLEARPSFRELLGRVRASAVGVYEHQDLPFEKIVEAVAPPRDPSRNPLVQVNMRVEGAEPELRLGELESEPIVIDPGIARFDLAIELGAASGGYAGYLEYDTALFAPARAAALARDYVSILAACVSEPDRPLSELDPIRAITHQASPSTHGVLND